MAVTMPRRHAYRIETLTYSTTSLVWLGTRKAAILFPPAHEGAPYQLYPHPDTYPGLTFAGLPAPLQPDFMPFASLDEVRVFLGLCPERAGDIPLTLAA
ncbi:hypothetical protein [Methylobacterium nigriterrae]|uniref:hypothetical protein n=1 Tax=Methylobacterium nigriterrae TaxID=3127512 RepID=UPI0030139EA8